MVHGVTGRLWSLNFMYCCLLRFKFGRACRFLYMLRYCCDLCLNSRLLLAVLLFAFG